MSMIAILWKIGIPVSITCFIKNFWSISEKQIYTRFLRIFITCQSFDQTIKFIYWTEFFYCIFSRFRIDLFQQYLVFILWWIEIKVQHFDGMPLLFFEGHMDRKVVISFLKLNSTKMYFISSYILRSISHFEGMSSFTLSKMPIH